MRRTMFDSVSQRLLSDSKKANGEIVGQMFQRAFGREDDFYVVPPRHFRTVRLERRNKPENA